MATPISVITRPQFTFSRWVGVGIAFHEERLFGCFAEQGSGSPLVGQEIGECAGDALPQGRRVGLKYDPLRPFVYRFAQVIHVAAGADVEVIRMGVVGTGAASPDLQRAVGFADHIDPFRVQSILLCFADPPFQSERAHHHFVCGSFVDFTRGIVAGIDSGNVAAGRHENVGAGRGSRIKDRYPRKINRAIAAGFAPGGRTDFVGRGRVRRFQPIKNCHPVAGILAVIQECLLNRLYRDPRCGDDGDFVNGGEFIQFIRGRRQVGFCRDSDDPTSRSAVVEKAEDRMGQVGVSGLNCTVVGNKVVPAGD